MSDAELLRSVVQAVRPRLQELGFRKRAGEIFTAEISEGVLGWLGLNHASRPGEGRIEINPVIGVRHQGVERLVAELAGRKFHEYVPATVSWPLGYLMPDPRYRPWFFPHGAMSEVASDFVAAFEQWGIPFMRRSSTLPALTRLIEEDMGYPHQLRERAPVVRLLDGDPRAAADLLQATLTKLGDATDPAAVNFRAFAARLSARLSAQT